MSKSLRPMVYSFVLFALVHALFLLLLIAVVSCVSVPTTAETLAATPAKVAACDNQLLKDFGAVKVIPVGPSVALIQNQVGELLSVTTPETLASAEEKLKANGFVADKTFKPVVCSIKGQTVLIQKRAPKAGV